MAQIKKLFDEYGIIYEACQILPDVTHRVDFLEALAELEDYECHRTHKFPKRRSRKKSRRRCVVSSSGCPVSSACTVNRGVRLRKD